MDSEVRLSVNALATVATVAGVVAVVAVVAVLVVAVLVTAVEPPLEPPPHAVRPMKRAVSELSRKALKNIVGGMRMVVRVLIHKTNHLNHVETRLAGVAMRVAWIVHEESLPPWLPAIAKLMAANLIEGGLVHLDDDGGAKPG